MLIEYSDAIGRVYARIGERAVRGRPLSARDGRVGAMSGSFVVAELVVADYGAAAGIAITVALVMMFLAVIAVPVGAVWLVVWLIRRWWRRSHPRPPSDDGAHLPPMP